VPIVTAMQDVKDLMDEAVDREIKALQSAVSSSSGGGGGFGSGSGNDEGQQGSSSSSSGAAISSNLHSRFVCRDHAVVLHIYSPAAPIMDLVDLPGIHASTSVGGSAPAHAGIGGGGGGLLSAGGLLNGGEDEMAFQTRALAATELRRARGHSLYLLVTPANLHHPSLSPLWDLVADEGDRMDDKMRIGVFTKCDRADDNEDEELGIPFAELRDRILQKKSAGCEHLPARGYVGTMIKPPKIQMGGGGGGGGVGGELQQHQSNLGRIRQEAVNETAWFKRNGMGDARDVARAAAAAGMGPNAVGTPFGRVGCNDLIAHLEVMYLDYVKETWVPAALNKLREEEDRMNDLIQSFGDPTLDAKAAAAAAGQHLTLHVPSILNAFAASVLCDFQSRVTVALRTRVAKGSMDFGAAMLAELLPAGGSLVDDTLKAGRSASASSSSLGELSPLDGLEMEVLDAVKEAVARRDEFWEGHLRPALEAEDSSNVKLARFPQFIDAIVARFNQLMSDPAPLSKFTEVVHT
jgi:hypothetical protein